MNNSFDMYAWRKNFITLDEEYNKLDEQIKDRADYLADWASANDVDLSNIKYSFSPSGFTGMLDGNEVFIEPSGEAFSIFDYSTGRKGEALFSNQRFDQKGYFDARSRTPDLEEEKTAFMTTSKGEERPIEYADKKDLDKFKNNSDIKSIKTADGATIKEADAEFEEFLSSYLAGASEEGEHVTDNAPKLEPGVRERKSRFTEAEVDPLAYFIKEDHFADSEAYPDYEGEMARSQLHAIIQDSEKIYGMLDNTTQLEAWVQGKLTKAEEYITTVHKYLDGQEVVHENKKSTKRKK